MDKLQKFDYMQSIEQFLEENQVYELFEDLMKQLIVARPDDPLQFLLKKLKQTTKSRRVFLMGPPGSHRQENAEALSEYFEWKRMSTGKLLRDHVNANGEHAARIKECFNKFRYVDDEIVISVVQKQIEAHEKKGESWICQGFPRTKVQALSLQKMGIIPDKLINLNIRKQTATQRIKQIINQSTQEIYADQADELAQRIYAEYEINQRGVLDTFNQFVYTCEAGDKPQQEIANDLATMLRIKYRNGAPRRPPKVIIIGPPGSGRSTQANLVAQAFGLVCISPAKLLKEEATKSPAIKMKIDNAAQKGEPVPDEILLRLIDERIRQSDCRVNGWILDGFPETESQVNLLKSMRIKPSLVCLFEQSVEESCRKLASRRIDPMTGQLFNVEVDKPKNDAQQLRLTMQAQDEESVVKARYEVWNNNQTMLEENFKQCLLSVPTDRLVDQIFESLKENIENPIF